MKKRTGEIVTDLLTKWDIDRIYGMPGDSINELVNDLRKQKEDIDFIQIRHEEVGALAASAYGKLTGKIGVCLSIAGPGAIHLLNGLYDAKQDGAPVLALVGQVSSNQVGTDAFQEVNLEQMFADVSVFNHRVEAAEQLPDLLNKAIRTAYAQNGVSVLIVPDDLFAVEQHYDNPLTSPIYEKPAIFPEHDSLTKAVDLINEAKKPVILAGRGAKHSRQELLSFATHIQAPIVLSLLGKGTISDDHVLNLGQHGQIGTKPAYEAIMDTDLLLMIGTSFPYPSFLPKNVKSIQMEIDPQKIGSFYPVTMGLCGDVKMILPELTSLVDVKTDGKFLDKYKGKMKKWHKQMKKDKKETSNPIQAPQLLYGLEKVVDKHAVISCDVGNVTVWTVRYFPFTNQDFVVSGRLATMGAGLPGAIAAQLAYPNKQVVAFCGDGGFSMVMQDMATAKKYNLPIKVIVFNNSAIAMIKYEQQEMGHLDYETELEGVNFAKLAEGFGVEGFRIERQEDLHASLQQAFSSNKPSIIDVAIDDKAPLPGKISYDQAIKYGEYLTKAFFQNKKVDFPNLKESINRLL
ncbi:pyruvate oxidase [Virgibacillus sp. W0181]|uniref:pyruvate oxidase n=1 Tax=Virgibacillus sp. W0181 TaxID=3391581 RepID=UPI003F46EA6B